jgi:anaerobic magnesium-protoporphyrin IX monomethyl ester cyclase
VIRESVVFVALKEYDHLGIGYMTSVLSEAGFESRVFDFNSKRADILQSLKRLKPQLIGFSVVYQYNITRFAELVTYLKEKGIKSHFTAGGHYASLKYEELFHFIPLLDSIVRFEGEYTLLELVKCIYRGTDWRKTEGIAYRHKNKIITNQLRPFEKDLDKFPFPARSPLREFAFNKKFATLIAGRGCIHNCSFCNVNKFYRHHSGTSKRVRKPEKVVQEMDYLFKKKKCAVFFFLDDDFPLRSAQEPEWTKKFCDKLQEHGLNEKIMWRIICRPDEVDEKIFSMMKEHGLFKVFLGIEEGTDIGLKRLNKHMTVSECMQGINILKKLGIGFDYGFMLFQPMTTYKSLNENLDFLQKLCGDGYTPVTFLKLMPYYETRIEQELLKSGRLKISPGKQDYDFIEKSLNHYYDFITDCFMEWLRYSDGLENISRWADNYYSVYKHYFGVNNIFIKLRRKLTRIISESNLFLLDTLKELSVIFQSGKYLTDNNILEGYRGRINLKHHSFMRRIHNNMDMLLLLGQEI